MKIGFDQNIYLLGFMGSGKSTMGPLLAKKLKMAFFDTDECVENKSGKSIAQIFLEEGEFSFREQERLCIDMVSHLHQFVVAIGGGAVMFADNWLNIKNSGLTVYLKCPFHAIWDRIKESKTRPLLSTNNSQQQFTKMKELLTKRLPFYERADLIFQCQEGESAIETTNRLARQLEDFI